VPTVSSNGITLTYETDGSPDGTPLLMIMGLGMQLTSWPQSLIDILVRQGYYVIRFDNRDSGLSSKLDHLGKPSLFWAFIKNRLNIRIKAPYTLRDMANDAVAVLDALDVSEAHVVGISMGGMIAQILTDHESLRIKSLTSIMSTSGRHGLPGPEPKIRKMFLTRPRGKEQLVEHFVRVFQLIGSKAYPTPEAQLREHISASIARCSTAAGTVRQMLAIAASGERVIQLARIQRPTLVIHGTDDPLIPLACGQDTARLVPGAVLRVIDGMGHDLPDVLMPVIAGLINAHCQGQKIPQVASLLRARQSTLL
jgi:pimeloyl-ACP methyl ester carboxylesterase